MIGMQRPKVIAVQSAASFTMLTRSSEPRAATAGPLTAAVWEALVAISDLLDLGAPENAGGHEDEHDGKNRERRHVLVFDRKVSRPEGLDEPDDEPAEHGAGERADAAEHGGGESLHAWHEAVRE